MGALSAAELVNVWERGVCQHPVDRALTVLSAYLSESRDKWARASVGSRDAALLQIYEQMAGSRLHAFAECALCAEPMEYSLSVQDLLAGQDQRYPDAELSMASGDISFRLRLVTSLDLAAVAGCENPEDAARLLAERCIVEARCGEETVAAATLPEAVIEEVGVHLAEADPQAETLIGLTCPSCAHTWQVLLDIESFLWTKINALAKRLLREVHMLSSAYGWREADILAMSVARREFYLEMLS